MHPCQEGYPCKYIRMVTPTLGKCMCATCPVKKVTFRDDPTQKEHAYDSLTESVTDWITVPPPKPIRDSLDQWYEEFTAKEFGKAITSADTYERKHGALRQKRHAVR